jgi:LmbE family N-acetylglucosaminyl deacetylase
MKAPEILEPIAGRVLCIAPHPDDESCGLGGTLARHRAQGDEVHIVFVTDGRSGDPDGRFGTSLPELREQEALAACEELGGASSEFYRFPDNRVASSTDIQMVSERFEESIDAFQPHVIYVPWAGEAHTDHANCHSALLALLERRVHEGRPLFARVLEYEVWSPLPADWIVDITDFAEAKRRAMRAHTSQVLYTDYPHQLLGLAAHRSVYLPKDSRYGEAFRETWRRT